MDIACNVERAFFASPPEFSAVAVAGVICPEQPPGFLTTLEVTTGAAAQPRQLQTTTHLAAGAINGVAELNGVDELNLIARVRYVFAAPATCSGVATAFPSL